MSGLLRRALLLSALVLGVASPTLARHGEVVLDARRATPGMRLTLTPVASSSTATPEYRLAASGVPPGMIFSVWTKEFGQDFREVIRGFVIDRTGALTLEDDEGHTRRLEDVVLRPALPPAGAAWEVALVSSDYSHMAYAKVIPRPIAGRDGPCAVTLELISRRADRFVAEAEGFPGGEEVTIERRADGPPVQTRHVVARDGRLPADVVAHVGTGVHRAQYAVRGRSCSVTVDYEWGLAAAARR
jgi:hypothetical protein